MALWAHLCCCWYPQQELEQKLEAADTALEENHDRISIMNEHLKNVHTELKYTQEKVSVAKVLAWSQRLSSTCASTQTGQRQFTCLVWGS